MTDSAVAADILHSLDIVCDFSAEIAFYGIFVFDDFTELSYVIISKILYSRIGINAGLFEDLLGRCKTDTENVGQTDLDALFSGKVYTC
jgi:hypothetical protein